MKTIAQYPTEMAIAHANVSMLVDMLNAARLVRGGGGPTEDLLRAEIERNVAAFAERLERQGAEMPLKADSDRP